MSTEGQIQTEQFHSNIMGYIYLCSILSLVLFSNKACGFPTNVPSRSLISCTDAEEEIAKRCGSLKLSEIILSQGFTAPLMIAQMSGMFLLAIAKVNSKNDAFGKWAGNSLQSQFPQNISSFSSNHIDCQLYERYTQCIDEHGILDRCFSNEDFITRASYGYICGVGKDDYLQSANCLERMDDYSALGYQIQAKAECQLNNVKVLDALYGTVATYKTTDVEQWLNDYLHNQQYLLCLYRERLHSCTGPWVRRQCGKKAESLAQGMVEHVMKSLTDFYKTVDSSFEILPVCAAQDATNVPQDGISETNVGKVFHDMHNAIDVLRPVLGKCSSSEQVLNFLLCGWQVLQESPTLVSIANSGSLLGWFEQACHSGLQRFHSCIEPKLESCPDGAFVDYINVIKAACASLSHIEPMSGCYLPVVNNIESACGINLGDLMNELNMMTRYVTDSNRQSTASKVTTLFMQRFQSWKCVVKYQKDATISKLPQRCGPKFKHDVEHIFDLIDKTVEDVPKFINNSLEEFQSILNYSNHIDCSDLAKSMVQKCGGQNLINSLNENSLFGKLLHNARLNEFFISPKTTQSSSHGRQRRFTHSLLKNQSDDIFLDSAFTANTVSNKSVEKACRKYEAYEKCLDKNVDTFGCRADSQIKSSWGYMCGKGKPDLMLSVSCLIKLDVSIMKEWRKSPDADTCRALPGKYKDSLHNSAADIMCFTRDYSAVCLEPMVKSKCGQHANDFYRGLVESIVGGFVAHFPPSFKPTKGCI